MKMTNASLLNKPKRSGNLMNGHQRGSSFLSIISCLILIFSGILSVLPALAIGVQNPPADRGDGTLENSGDWIIEEGDDLQYTGETIVINGNLTIDGKLTLTQCILIMNVSSSILSVNGELVLQDTNISGNEVYYDFIIHGIFRSSESHFSDIAGSKTPPYIGGMQIYSEDVWIDGGSITNNEFTGIYITTYIVIKNFTIERHEYNVIVNGSSPQFLDCSLRLIGGSVSLYLLNGASPLFVDCIRSGSTQCDNDKNSSYSIAHRLSVHVVFDNGTAIPGVNVNVESIEGDISQDTVTDDEGWVRDMVLPKNTVFESSGDKLYSPYLVSAEKFGIQVQKSVPFEDTTQVEIILTGDYFGYALTRGDFNGDSLQDLAVGVPKNTSGTQTPGAVFIFFNAGDLEIMDLDESMADLRIPGEEGTDFGSVLSSGDLNGDGYDELLLATPASSENGDNAGRVYIFLGAVVPEWDTTDDAGLIFDGESGTNFGSQLYCGEITGDTYEDFIIGDNFNSYVYYGSPDPVDLYTRVSEFSSYATGKGGADDTSQSVTLLKSNDDDRYELNPQERLHINNFTLEEIKGTLTEVTMRFQFVTDRYYGYNAGERGYVYYSINGEDWHETVRPQAPNNDWDEETTLTFDLFDHGVTELNQLENLQIYFKNEEGTEGQDHYIHIDFILIDVATIPSGANHTLPSGNLSIGDINDDGYQDLLVSDPSQQAVYFGGLQGISAPVLIHVDPHEGNSTRIWPSHGNLTISETRPYLNGQFDDEWAGWRQVANSLGLKDGGVRWSIVDQENGDWHVNEGFTGGFGSDRDTVGGGGWGGQDCRGMLRTGNFLITEDMKTINFWYHFRVNSFDQAGGGQGENADQVRYRLYSTENNSVLMELAGWAPTDSDGEYEDDGFVSANISDLQGEMVYFGFEIITNRGNGDRAIAQLDNLTILPPSEKPYYENGSFESQWFTFEQNLTSITPSWIQNLNNGTISMQFRFDPDDDWENRTESISGDNIDLASPSQRFQYRVVMTNNASATPILGELSIGYLLEGQMLPLYLETGYGNVKLGDIDGDGADDLLYLDYGGTRGNGKRGGEEAEGDGGEGEEGEGEAAVGINVFYGSPTIQDDYQTNGIQNFYTGTVYDFSLLDLEMDGQDEIGVAGNSIQILDVNGAAVWEKDTRGLKVSGDIASDPEFELNTGALYFLPAYDHELRIINMDIPALVPPNTQQTINITVGNIGLIDIVGLTLFANITADGYSELFSTDMDVDSLARELFSFPWDVPGDEGIRYTLRVEAYLTDDRVPGNNIVEKDVTSMKHGVSITSAPPSTPAASAHGGDDLTYMVLLTNIGTFATEAVDLVSTVPVGWTGSFYHPDDNDFDTPIDSVTIEDTMELTYIAVSPVDEVNDDYVLNLSATASSAVSWLDLTATILRPDLIVAELVLCREDGVVTNDTIHGVEGEDEVIKIKITNQGPTYTGSFSVTLDQEDTPLATYPHDGLGAGESVWFTYPIVPEIGTLSITVAVDTDDEVTEMDEDNNELSRDFTIKSTNSVGDYALSGKVVDIDGVGVDLAEVFLEWPSNSEKLFTDENGSFQFSISQAQYSDTMILYINATDGANTTHFMVILYSEDGGKYLVLTLNQYLVEITGPDTVSSIGTGEMASVTLDVHNRGNTDATFIIMGSELPTDWSVEFTGYPDGSFDLPVDESLSLEVVIHASPDSQYSMGYLRYFATLLVYAEQYPDASDTFTHGLQVEPERSLVVTVSDTDTKESQPNRQVSYQFSVENQGNIKDTFIPEIMGYALEEYSFDVTHSILEIGGSVQFTLQFTMPNIPAGSSFDLLVGNNDPQTTNARITTTALDYYAVTGDHSLSISAKPGDSLSIPVTITNTGNLEATATITPWSPRSGVGTEIGDVELDMSEKTVHIIRVNLPADALRDEVISLFINLTIGDPDGDPSIAYFNTSMVIVIAESFGMELSLLETIIITGVEYTTYSYELDAVNTGNGLNTFHFKAEGTHPHYLSLPAPVELQPGERTVIIARIIMPVNRTGVVDNYIVPTDGAHDFGDVNLRILSYSMDLNIDIATTQDSQGYRYQVTVENNGTRYERITLVTNLPQVDSYKASDKRWEGGTNKDILELAPGETDTFTVTIRTPEERKYWGGDLTMTLDSDSGRSQTLTLSKPPIPILGAPLPDVITIEDTLTFSGSQSYWNIIDYQWDLGDGTTADGSTISHSYSRSGEYTVTMTVTDDIGFNATKSVDVIVNNMVPVVSLITSPSNRTVEVDQPIVLDGSFSQDRDGEIVSFSWDFGNFGEFYEGMFSVIEHSYDQIGTYDVTLLVTDNMGGSINTTITVYVTEKTTPTNGGLDPEPVEEVTTDKLSYVPAILVVVLLGAGGVLILTKKTMIKHMQEKIREQERQS